MRTISPSKKYGYLHVSAEGMMLTSTFEGEPVQKCPTLPKNIEEEYFEIKARNAAQDAMQVKPQRQLKRHRRTQRVIKGVQKAR